MLHQRLLIILTFAALCAGGGAADSLAASEFPVICGQRYPQHLQGFCADPEHKTLLWSFTTALVKTDLKGTPLEQKEVANHHGDVCLHDGRLYVAVNLGDFNNPEGKADSWVYVYNARSLTFLSKHAVPEVKYGAGGIAFKDGRFFVVGGLPEGTPYNLVYEYDGDFKHVKTHELAGGYTLMGIQTATFANGSWWFGCYGKPQMLLKATPDLSQVERFEFDCSLGVAPWDEQHLLVASGDCRRGLGCSGEVTLAVADDETGLRRVGSPAIELNGAPGRLRITIGGRPFADYVYEDSKILRPYLAHLKTPGGLQVSRTHPPVAGTDATDHDTMHPGLWLAFGNVSGGDFWRNKARVRHEKFLQPPRDGSFAVRNVYEANGSTVALEDCRIVVEPAAHGGVRLLWESTFHHPDREIVFGDQEEMGLGVRVATPLTVDNGGEIVDAADRHNGAEVWGQTADWCLYRGRIGDQQVGVQLIPDPRNFRASWFHARDYGLLVANPFGRRAFTKGEPSRLVIPPGERFTLRFAVVVFEGSPDPAAAYRTAVTRLATVFP